MDFNENDQNISNVLVTGGCGFLGSHIIQLLLNDPDCGSVFVLSRHPIVNRHPNVTYHAGDITEPNTVRSINEIAKPSMIIHTVSPRYTDNTQVLHNTNAIGTRVLLQSIVPVDYQQTEETAELYTANSKIYPYAQTKAIADALVLQANSPSLRTATIRIPTVYSEGDYHCIPALLSNLRKGQHKVQLGPNKKIFEYVYVDSAAAAHILAAKALLVCARSEQPFGGSKVDGEAFLITDGLPMPFFDFAREVYAFAGHPVSQDEVKVIPYGLVLAFTLLSGWAYWIFTLGTKFPEVRKVGIQYLDRGCQFSIEKAKDRLGCKPKPNQDDAIRRSVEWALLEEQRGI
ncbi:hypothetical protein MMC18_008085 [Xylographa bjoerkii]|nr:hypothetical protein [Xylographa bjoerkii]